MVTRIIIPCNIITLFLPLVFVSFIIHHSFFLSDGELYFSFTHEDHKVNYFMIIGVTLLMKEGWCGLLTRSLTSFIFLLFLTFTCFSFFYSTSFSLLMMVCSLLFSLNFMEIFTKYFILLLESSYFLLYIGREDRDYFYHKVVYFMNTKTFLLQLKNVDSFFRISTFFCFI